MVAGNADNHSTLLPQFGVEHAYIFEWDGSNQTAYLDGLQGKVIPYSGTDATAIRIGASSQNQSNQWNGTIRDLKIYDTDQTTLLHHWKFDEGFGTTANDSVGGAHLDLTGIGTWEEL
jgi:hypothetical protein